MTTISTPHANVITGGVLNHLALDAKARHATGGYDNTHTWYDIESKFLPLSDALGIIQVPDTTITQYPLYIEIGSVDDQVPADLFGATTTDAETGETTSNTWATWMLPNHHATELDGRLFIHASAHTSSHPELSELLPVKSSLLQVADLPSNPE
jgi:hypothetical protein